MQHNSRLRRQNTGETTQESLKKSQHVAKDKRAQQVKKKGHRAEKETEQKNNDDTVCHRCHRVHFKSNEETQ